MRRISLPYLGIEHWRGRRGPVTDDCAQDVATNPYSGLTASDHRQCMPVDICLVAEATFPYRKGGVASILHQTMMETPERSFGIIHVTWDRSCIEPPVYDPPGNLKWIYHVFLSEREALPRSPYRLAGILHRLRFRPRRAAKELAKAVASAVESDASALWTFVETHLAPRSGGHGFWRMARKRAFVTALLEEMREIDLPLADLYWVYRQFMTMARGLTLRDYPKASVYHSHTQLYAGLAAAYAARTNAGKFVLTEHSLYVRDNLNSLRGAGLSEPVDRRAIVTDELLGEKARLWAGWTLAIGQMVYDACDASTYQYRRNVTEANALGNHPHKVRMISNGVDFDRYAFARRKQEERDNHRVFIGESSKGRPYEWRLAYMGRVVLMKGIVDLIHAVSILRLQWHLPMSLDIIGPCDEFPEFLAECEKIVADLRLSQDIRFCGYQDLSLALGSVDLMVLPSHSEALPIVVLEAMASGVPIVATDVGSIRQIIAEPIDDEEALGDCPAGLVVPPKNPELLALAIERLLSDRELYLAMRRFGPLRVSHRHRAPDIMAMYHHLYHEMEPSFGSLTGGELQSLDDEMQRLVRDVNRRGPSTNASA